MMSVRPEKQRVAVGGNRYHPNPKMRDGGKKRCLKEFFFSFLYGRKKFYCGNQIFYFDILLPVLRLTLVFLFFETTQ